MGNESFEGTGAGDPAGGDGEDFAEPFLVIPALSYNHIPLFTLLYQPTYREDIEGRIVVDFTTRTCILPDD